MEEHDIKRKLATIMVADIVGFSRLTANDEDWTIRSLGEFRKIVDEIIDRHDGRIFNTGGDSVLAEFASPVEAVRCAVDFQEAARSRNLLQPRDRQLRFRIGINLGDVMVRGSDLLGDGVNVAARLEGLAEAGGICVSGSVWDQVNGKLSIGYIDIGEQSVKNIPRPVRAYHLRVDGDIQEVGKPAVAPASGMPVPLRREQPRRPLVAALIGAAAVIVLLAGGLAWQLWPRSTQPPTARTVRPSPAAPSAAASSSPPVAPAVTPLQESLSARLASAVPNLVGAVREEAVRIYINAPANKALAASLDPVGYWEARDRPTPENARESVLEGCQVYHGHPCLLVAVGDAIQPASAIPQDMPRVRYSGDFDPGQIPGSWLVLRQRDDIANYRAATAPKAVAYHPNHVRVFVVTNAANQRAAGEQALKTCNDDTARNKLRGPCFLYAVDNRVVLPLRLTEP
jgi:class 3 adenylate cyclase